MGMKGKYFTPALSPVAVVPAPPWWISISTTQETVSIRRKFLRGQWGYKEGLPQPNIEETTNREDSPPRGIHYQELQQLQDDKKMYSEYVKAIRKTSSGHGASKQKAQKLLTVSKTTPTSINYSSLFCISQCFQYNVHCFFWIIKRLVV